MNEISKKELMQYLDCATIDITSKCNLNCKHCRLEKIPYDMTLEEIELICQKLAAYRTRAVFISGGEPLCRKDITEVVRLMKKYIPVITLNTNSLLLDKDLLEDLIAAGVDYIQVSLDGLEKNHDFIRGEGTFARTIERLELIGAYKDQVRLHISSCISRSNLDQMDAFADYLINDKKMPIQILGFKRYIPKNVLADRFSLGKEGLRELYDNICRLEKEYRGRVRIACDFPLKNVYQEELVKKVMDKYSLRCAGCSAATGGPAIRSDGSVSPCSLLDVSYGSILTESIEDIYRSDLFLNLVERNLKGKCGICDHRLTCGGCRAAAYLLTGDYLGEDVECFL